MASKTPSAWAKPESTPAPEPAREPLVVVFSGAVAEDRWVKELPTSPKGFVKLARENGWAVTVHEAVVANSTSEIRSWKVKAVKSIGAVIVWEHLCGDVAKTKQKCHVGTAYIYAEGLGLQKSTVTEIKNAIKGSK